ncbi:PIN domain-containing protein [Parapedobacter tibetensis]
MSWSDTPFVALALELNTKLWTGDKTLAKGLQKKCSSIIIGTTEMKSLLK